MTPKKVFITGICGFLGSSLAARLVLDGHEVWGLDRIPSSNPGLRNESVSLVDADWGKILAWNPDFLIHLAGPASVRQSYEAPYREAVDGLGGTAFLLEKLRGHRGVTLIFFSTAGVYGDQPFERYHEDLPLQPLSPYAVTKMACERFIRSEAERQGLRHLILRPFSVYGPGLGKQVVYDLSRRFLSGENPMLIEGTGREMRDFVHVEDCCKVVSALLGRELPSGLVLNVGTGKATSLAELAAMIGHHSGYPHSIAFTGRDFPGNPSNLVADTARLGKLGLSCPTGLDTGIPGVLEAIRARG